MLVTTVIRHAGLPNYSALPPPQVYSRTWDVLHSFHSRVVQEVGFYRLPDRRGTKTTIKHRFGAPYFQPLPPFPSDSRQWPGPAAHPYTPSVGTGITAPGTLNWPLIFKYWWKECVELYLHSPMSSCREHLSTFYSSELAYCFSARGRLFLNKKWEKLMSRGRVTSLWLLVRQL